MPLTDLETYRREVLRAPHGREMALTVAREGVPDPVVLTLVPGGSERLGVIPRANVIDDVERGSSAHRAGIRAGDEILALDGQTVWNEDDIHRIVRSRPEQALTVQVRRPGVPEPLALPLTTGVREEPHAAFNPFDHPSEPVIQEIHPASPVRGRLQRWDRIVKIGGEPVKVVRQVLEKVGASPGTPLAIEVEREGKIVALEVTPRRAPNGRGVLDIRLGREGVCLVGKIPEDSPLKGAAANWDRVESADGIPVPAAGWLSDHIKASPGKSLSLVLARGAERKTVELPVERGGDGKGRAKAEFVQAFPVLHEVPESWPLAAAGLRAGDRVLRLDTDGDGVLEVCKSLGELNTAARRRKPFPVVVERDGKELPAVDVAPGAIRHGALGVTLGVLTEYRRYGPGEALILGAQEPIDIVVMTYQLLARILGGGESLSGVGGPIRIFGISYKVTGHGTGNFLWLLAMISVNLAVFNLLPIPILDGGHILFLIVEKLKGSPVSETVLIRAQYVGLAFLFSLLILVTTNDILSGFFH
jgi:regulator of sigma E protease